MTEPSVTRREALGLAIAAMPCAAMLLATRPEEAQAQLQAASPAATAASQAGSAAEGKPSVTYRAYVRKRGWQSPKTGGQTAGTTGKGRALGGISVKVGTGGMAGSVTYCAHVAGVGWQGWKKAGALSGSKARNLEAVRIKLTGEFARKYDVYYRAHIANYGWLDWAKNGAAAGSTGLGVRMEALQVKLVKKGTTFKGKTSTHVLATRWQGIEFQYRGNSAVRQLLEVKYTGGSKARVVLRKKKGASWTTVLSCQGYVGRMGIGKSREGDGRTPSGDFGITRAFGIQGNPGAKLPYTHVNSSHYWCADGAYYNRLVNINKNPHYCAGEHLIDYRPHYNYGLFIDFNTNPVVYGAGSAIFVHCTGSAKYTAGCIAVSQGNMVKIIRNVSSGARLCVYPK